ncbi:universal stress protein [Streptomyces sp. NPDC059785]|uniref:universal stress protein n=1 Tax=unclassified Streptomyces TaxID=2593676 RepID=UPI0036561E92
MVRTITVGFDGSPESRAAAEWAAREAKSRGLPLKLLQVWEPVPDPVAQAPLLGAETRQQWTGRTARGSAAGLRLRHTGLEVTGEHVTGRAGEALCEAARTTELLVVGSRGLGGVAGFLLGSVGLAVVARTECPVVLVREGEQAADEHEPDPAGVPSVEASFRPVVLGLDVAHADGALLEFAFAAAVRRAAPLRVVHAWNPPPSYAYALPADPELHGELARRAAAALTEALVPWRRKYPDVEIVEECRYGSPAVVLAEASRAASLVVVGRRIRHRPLGAHIGHVTHAVLHHATAPVAVVAHD